MAFSVSPTSGAAPYVFEAEISETHLIESGLYRLEFASSQSTLSCPTSPTGGTLIPEASEALLSSGQYIRPTNVNSGQCNASVLRMVRVSDNAIISYMLVNIDNRV